MPETFNPFLIEENKSSDNSDVYDPDVQFFNQVNAGNNACHYYNENDFHNLCKASDMNEGLSLIHVNIHSLPKNFDHLVHYLTVLNHEFSVVALTETWLSEMNQDAYNLPNYVSVHSVRKERVVLHS